MATSGISVYQLTRDELITSAAELLGVLASGQSLTSTQVTRGAQYLNRWLIAHRSDFPLNKRTTYSFSPQEGVVSYEIGIGKSLNVAYPTKLLQAWSVDGATDNNSRTEMNIVADQDFNILPSNTSGGQTIQMAYQPKINYGIIRIWPTPDSYVEDNETITIVYESPIEVFTAATQTMDLPEEWYEALIRGVASNWAPAWGIPLEDRKMLTTEAERYLQLAKEAGQENASIFFQPARR